MVSMRESVEEALRARAGADARDAAAERLAAHYAELIDEAAPAAKYRKGLTLLARAVRLYQGEDAFDIQEALETITIALGEHSVTSDLGPKLLAALTSLGLTTAGRGATKDGGGQRAEPSNPIDEIKRKRAERAARGTG
jgi:hypothetical protein